MQRHLFASLLMLALTFSACGAGPASGDATPAATAVADVAPAATPAAPAADPTAGPELPAPPPSQPATATREEPAPPPSPAPVAKKAPAPAQPPSPAPGAPPTPETTPAPVPEAAGPDHRLWNELLSTYVDAGGRVDYAGLKADKTRLQQYLDLLAANPVRDNWSRQEKMAYWINAYNAFTIKLIVDNYPLKSIRDLHGGNPWDVAWIKLGGRSYSLNNIENDILRPQFQDPRIHFAVNCAAKSCPPLLNRAFTAAQLEQQLDRQTRQFINNPAFNQLAPGTVRVSKIFEWYAQDFGALTGFLKRYTGVDLKSDARVTYNEYDWALNNQ